MPKCKICGTETGMPFHTCRVPAAVAELRVELAAVTAERDALIRFINDEMQMTAADPRVARLAGMMAVNK